MEVEASLVVMVIAQDMFSKVGDGDCSRQVFKGGSTQR